MSFLKIVNQKTPMKTYQPGQRVFTTNGQEGKFISEVNGKFAVYPVELWGDEEHLGEMTIWDRICEEPPTEKLHQEVTDLEKKMQDLRDQICALQKSRREEEALIEARMERFKTHETLQILEDFLDGKVTHYVVFPEYASDSVSIVEIKNTKGEYSERLKLVSLSGAYEGWEKKLTFRLHSYADGGGGSKPMIPCRSYEEALEKVAAYYEAQWEKARAYPIREDLGCRYMSYEKMVIPHAEALGLPIPEDIRKAVAEYEMASIDCSLREAGKKVAELLAKKEKLVQP